MGFGRAGEERVRLNGLCPQHGALLAAHMSLAPAWSGPPPDAAPFDRAHRHTCPTPCQPCPPFHPCSWVLGSKAARFLLIPLLNLRCPASVPQPPSPSAAGCLAARA